jgi:tetratricopeptide (TPR) repeat protein
MAKTRQKLSDRSPGPARPSGDPAVLWQASTQAAAAGDFVAAEKNLKRLLKKFPDDANVLGLLGTVRAQRGDHKSALRALDKAVRIDATNATTQASLAVCCEALGKTERARTAYQDALSLDSDLIQARVNYASLLWREKRLNEAEAQCRAAIETSPKFVPAHLCLARVLYDIGRIGAAIASVDCALKLSPNHPQALLLRGQAARASGDFEDARGYFKGAIAADPDATAAYVAYTTTGACDRADPLVQQFVDLAQRDDFLPGSQAELAFAYGSMLRDEGDTDAAFQHWASGARLRAKERPWIARDGEKKYAQTIEAYNEALFARRLTAPVAGPVPVFVIGMPRSGTTLVEQILASHAAVGTAGERLDVVALARDFSLWAGSASGYPAGMVDVSNANLGEAAARYIQGFENFGAAPLMIDKMPVNFEHLGLIAMLFPNARIVHCRRNPVDTCLSCFSTDFAYGLGWSFDQRWLAKYYGLYSRYMQHWNGVLPLAVHEIIYEDVVSDIEVQARALVEFCELDWDPACLDFHKSSHPVKTASSTQVRRPLYSDSVAGWRRYEEQLGPLVDGLKQEGIPVE